MEGDGQAEQRGRGFEEDLRCLSQPDRLTGRRVEWVWRRLASLRCLQRTYREIVFLREFGEHPNVIRLQNVMRADNDRDIYLVFEFMGKNVRQVDLRRANPLGLLQRRIFITLFARAIFSKTRISVT